MRELNEECGVVGVIGAENAANLIYLALYALQHRGQEASGIVTLDEDGDFRAHKNFGLVREVFDQDSINKLQGSKGIGHNRYSTQGGRLVQNIQPFYFNSALGPISIAQNGNLTNAAHLRRELEQQGSIFHSTSDTEVLNHLIAKGTEEDIVDRVCGALPLVRGSYSLVVLTADKLIGARDPYGFRPLVLGRRNGAYILASETCALDLIAAEFIREIEPGEVLEISAGGVLKSYYPHSRLKPGHCSFEPIYFSRPDSKVFGQSVYDLRKRMGQVLARESGIDADVVVAVPDSGVPLASGYAAESKIPMELGLVRNHYIGRTFIEPTQNIRDFGVRLKLNPVANVLAGKRVIVVDDSIVRGTTSIKILRMIREAKAKEIHFRIGSPPITHSCYFGVDTPDREDLLAAQKNIKEMAKFIGADTLAFLSLDGLKEALGGGNEYCFGCFSGNYPEDIGEPINPQPTDGQGGPGYQSWLVES